ncbi:hypothetical protein MM239_17865 [Belliella sp. DSM 111904]|uniref:Carboxypeptidase regulatory-like domain-containing protein n=1 Tax=Belliella filtrata TaxID=2923435 RepID=A0ABS9V4C2_9BACT|nr:hypothetical protein [Belliella filtrata]MCH7411267.1 hypothetical protein [Belliella filtrata]
MKNPFLVLGVFLSITNCAPEKTINHPEPTLVNGYLMVLGTNDTIRDRPYKIALLRNSRRKVYDETYTDDNGYFELEHISEEGDNPVVYELRFDDHIPDETFTGEIAVFVDTLAPNSGVSQLRPGSYKGRGGFSSGFQSWANVTLEKRAWLELEVENIDPQLGDQIRIKFVSHRAGTGSWEHTFYHGQHWKIILPGVGNVENILEYSVKIEDGFVPKTERILLGEMDTTYFKLEY